MIAEAIESGISEDNNNKLLQVLNNLNNTVELLWGINFDGEGERMISEMSMLIQRSLEIGTMLYTKAQKSM